MLLRYRVGERRKERARKRERRALIECINCASARDKSRRSGGRDEISGDFIIVETTSQFAQYLTLITRRKPVQKRESEIASFAFQQIDIIGFPLLTATQTTSLTYTNCIRNLPEFSL